jgi:N-acetylneuraminate synthase
VEIAKQLIDMAVDCGCDAVKFQKRTIELVYSPEELARPRESPWGTTNGDQKRGLEFGRDEYDEIDAYCLQQGIHWFASAWDVESLRFLAQYDLKYNKVASAMVTSEDFLDVVAAERRETFVSTGMTTLRQIERAASIFREARCPFVLMHTVSTYPTPDHELNLRCIQALRQIHPRVGYSGHEVSPLPSIVAAALGAEVIERHITLDRTMYGSDQAASLERRGLESMVDGIRRVPLYLGTGVKVITPGERDVAKKLRYFEEAA